MKKYIMALLAASELSNKEIVALLDEIRKEYHKPMNVGTKILDQKEHSNLKAEINGSLYTVSKDKRFVFYLGGWRVINGYAKDKFITYLKTKKALVLRKPKQ